MDVEWIHGSEDQEVVKTFIMKALARLPAETGIAAMQSINVAAVKVESPPNRRSDGRCGLADGGLGWGPQASSPDASDGPTAGDAPNSGK